MELSIIIRQKKLFLKKPDLKQIEKLFGRTYLTGGIGPNYTYQVEPGTPAQGNEAEYFFYEGGGQPLGRGFYLYISKGYGSFSVTTGLPTTAHDLDAVHTFVSALASYLEEANMETGDGRKVSVPGLPAFFREEKVANNQLLQTMARQQPCFGVSGIKYPVYLDEETSEKMAGQAPIDAERSFSLYLAKKQRGTYYYMRPSYFRDKDTQRPIAVYALTEAVTSIIPMEPFVPFGPPPFGPEPISEWLIGLVSNRNGTLGRIPYSTFLSYLQDEEYDWFDGKHYLLKGMPQRRMKEILESASD